MLHQRAMSRLALGKGGRGGPSHHLGVWNSSWSPAGTASKETSWRPVRNEKQRRFDRATGQTTGKGYNATRQVSFRGACWSPDAGRLVVSVRLRGGADRDRAAHGLQRSDAG